MLECVVHPKYVADTGRGLALFIEAITQKRRQKFERMNLRLSGTPERVHSLERWPFSSTH
jgi:hypothetical protein